MTIDWDKPLRAVDNSSSRWEVLYEDGNYRWCFQINRPQLAYKFLNTGVCMAGELGVQLENVPQEPEREAGYYWSYTKRAGHAAVMYWDGGDVSSNYTIGSRVFKDSEFRPANSPTGGPPMDGTPFEVEGVASGLFEAAIDEEGHLVFQVPDHRSDSWLVRIWPRSMRSRRWRPVQ